MTTTITLNYNRNIFKLASVYLETIVEPDWKDRGNFSYLFTHAKVNSITYGVGYNSSVARVELSTTRFGNLVNVLKGMLVRVVLLCPLSATKTTLFKGTITGISSTLGPSSDVVSVTIQGYRYIMSQEIIIGGVEEKTAYEISIDDTNTLKYLSDKEFIFNRNGEKNRSSKYYRVKYTGKSIVEATLSDIDDYPNRGTTISHSLAFPVFSANNVSDAEYWTFEDILRYIFAIFIIPDLSAYIKTISDEEWCESQTDEEIKNDPDWDTTYIKPPKDTRRSFYIQAPDDYMFFGKNYVECLNTIFNDIDPSNYFWYLDTMNEGIPAIFKWARRGGTSSLKRNLAIPTTAGLRRVGMGSTPIEISADEELGRAVKNIIAIGDYIGVQTAIPLKPLWTDADREELVNNVFDEDDEIFQYIQLNADEQEIFKIYGFPEDYDFTTLETYLTGKLGNPTDVFGNVLDTWFSEPPRISVSRQTEYIVTKNKKKLKATILISTDDTTWVDATDEEGFTIRVDEENGLVIFKQAVFNTEDLDEEDYPEGSNRKYDLANIDAAIIATIKTGVRFSVIYTIDEAEGDSTIVVEVPKAKQIIRKNEYVTSKIADKLVDAIITGSVGKLTVGEEEEKAVVFTEIANGTWIKLKDSIVGEIDYGYVKNDGDKLYDAVQKTINRQGEAAKVINASFPYLNIGLKPGQTIRYIIHGGDYHESFRYKWNDEEKRWERKDTPLSVIITSVTHDLVNWRTSLTAEK